MTPLARHLLSAVACFAVALSLRADWKTDTGYTLLQETFTSGVPDSIAAGVAQIEADDGTGNNYQPDFAKSQFSGKTLNVKSTGIGTSDHATNVGGYFYGNSNSLIAGTNQIDSYDAIYNNSTSGWLFSEFLNVNTSSLPLTETRRVQNHSWIASTGGSNTAVTNIDERFDYAIDRDGFVAVLGEANGYSTTLPDLMGQGYHTISVGLVNGNHSAGLTAYDTTGRMKPDIVAFETLTSYATPQVSSAAGLISEKLRNTYSASLTTAADYPRLTKALLLAGAAKDPLSGWSRADTTKPYDARYGAGALNVFLAYRILDAGNVTYSGSSTVPCTAWSVASVSNTPPSNATRTYFFDVPAGSVSSRFSAALVWHRAISPGSNGSFTASVANLDLKLYNVTGGTFTLGSLVDSSVSTVDNVEHVYQASLPPGRYALQVIKTSGSTTTYALAWRTSPTVTVAATSPTARELDGATGLFTLTRTGPTTSPLLVPLAWSGTAVAGTHYSTPPSSVLIPAGSSSATVTVTPVADDIAQGDRTVILTVATDFSLSAGATASDTVTIQDKPYDAWRFARFTTAELADTSVSGPAADPDHDGLANLMEYALDAEPETSDATTHAPVVGLSSGYLTLTYTRPSSIADVSYTVQWSADLQSWSSGSGVAETVSTTNNGDGTSTIVSRSVTPMADNVRQFLRLQVTRP